MTEKIMKKKLKVMNANDFSLCREHRVPRVCTQAKNAGTKVQTMTQERTEFTGRPYEI